MACLFCDRIYSQNLIPIGGDVIGESLQKETIESTPYCYKVRVRLNSPIGQVEYLSNRIRLSKTGLPLFSHLIAIPTDAKVHASITEEKWEELDVTGLPVIEKDPVLITYGNIQTLRGIKNLSINICPFRRSVNKNRLSILSEYVLQVDFVQSERVQNSNLFSKKEKDNCLLFENDVYVKVADISTKQSVLLSGDAYDYLIIVGNNNSILNSEELKRFKRWKALKGFKTKIVSINDIVAAGFYDIKSYIAQEYYNYGIKYVLLIGDNGTIPMGYKQRFYDRSQHMDSDYWYGCMDGDDDWEQDVYIGRFSVNSSLSFSNMVEKTIRYECTSPKSNKILLVAHKDNPYYIRSYQNCSEQIRNATYLEQMSFVTAYGASVLDDGNNATNASVVDSINSGIAIVNYRGYGQPCYWGGVEGNVSSVGWNSSNEFFLYTQIVNLDSLTNTVFFSASPYTGKISTIGNMLETFTRAPYGAVAFIGSTIEEGFTDCNNLYDRRVYLYLLNDGIYNLGELNCYSHISSVYDNNENSMAKDNAFSYICGGDPTLELWTTKDVDTFKNVNVMLSNGIVTINMNSVSNYTVCLSTEDGELIDIIHGNGSICSFPRPNCNFYLAINKHNYIPYLIYCNGYSDFIQNVKFDCDAYYDHSPLTISDGYSPEVEDGEVIVKKGHKLIIKNGQEGVLIESGFECERGAEFEIK